MRLLAAIFFGVLFYNPHALASELALSWQAPEGCPRLSELQAGLATRQKRLVQLGADAPVRIDAKVTRDRAGFRLELRTHTENGDSQRELYTQSCNELARATLLLASLLLSTPPPAAKPDAPAAQVEPAAGGTRARRASWHIAVAGVLDAGKLAVFAPGASVRLGLDLDALRLRAGALYLPARAVAIEQAPGADVVLQLMAAETALCYAWTRAPRLASCVYAELGSLRARGRNQARDESSSSLWLSAGLGAQLSVGLASWLELETELSAGVPFQRAQFATRDLGLVYRVSALHGQLQAGLCAHFR